RVADEREQVLARLRNVADRGLPSFLRRIRAVLEGGVSVLEHAGAEAAQAGIAPRRSVPLEECQRAATRIEPCPRDHHVLVPSARKLELRRRDTLQAGDVFEDDVNEG